MFIFYVFPEVVQWRKLCFGSRFKRTVRQGWEGIVAGMAITMATASHTALIVRKRSGRKAGTQMDFFIFSFT